MSQAGNPNGVTLQPSRAPTRSLLACLECRKSKVKCSAQQPCKRCTTLSRECVFVAPRPTIVASSDLAATHDSDGELGTSDLASKLWRAIEDLEKKHEAKLAHQGREIAQLKEMLDESDSPHRKRRRLEVDSLDTPSVLASPSSQYPHSVDIPLLEPSHDREPDLVSNGFVNESDVAELCAAYYSKCATRISVLLPAPPRAQIRLFPHLFSTVLTLGLRATTGRSAQHSICRVETMKALRSARPSTAAEREANIHAMLHFAMWFADCNFARLAVVEAYEAKLFTSPILAGEARKDCELRNADTENETELAVAQRMRLWLSTCLVDQLMAVFGNTPCLISRFYILSTLEESRLRLRSLRGTTAWDLTALANGELFEISLAAQDAFAPFRHPHLVMGMDAITQLQRLNELLEDWSRRWDCNTEPGTSPSGEDRNRLKIPYAYVKMYINSFAINGLHEGPVQHTALDSTRLHCIEMATDGAVSLLKYALQSPTYHATLSYSIDFAFRNTVGPCGSFLFNVCRLIPGAVDVESIAETLRKTAEMLQTFGPGTGSYRAEFTLMQERIDEMVLHSRMSTAMSQPNLGGSSAINIPHENNQYQIPELEAGDQWQSLLDLMKEVSGWDQFGLATNGF